MSKTQPEIYLYEYPMEDVPIDLNQSITLLNLHPLVEQLIRTLENALYKIVKSPYKPPTSWVDPLLLATSPNFLRGFHWEWDNVKGAGFMRPAIMTGKVEDTNPFSALILGWVNVWKEVVQTNYLEAFPQAENLVACVMKLWQEGTLLVSTHSTVADVVLNDDGELNDLAYKLVPAILLRWLHGQKTFLVEGIDAVWEIVSGRQETYIISQLLKADNGGSFSYKVELDLQTLAGNDDEVPVIHVRLRQQRYPDGIIEALPKNEHSVLLRTSDGLWCKVSSKDYDHVRREVEVGKQVMPEWDVLPNLDELYAQPINYLDDARIVYLTGMEYEQEDSALLEVGMTFTEKRDVLEPVIQQLKLGKSSQVMIDQEQANLLSNLGGKTQARAIWDVDKLKRSKADDPGTVLSERIMVATGGRGLEIVVVTKQNHEKLVNEVLPDAIKEVFTVNPNKIESDFWEIIPNVTCRIIKLASEAAALFKPLPYETVTQIDKKGKMSPKTAKWRPIYKQRYQGLVDMLGECLPTDAGPVRLALVDKPSPPGGKLTQWCDVKGAIRAALADTSYLSQFMNPYRVGKNGEEYMPKDVSHRVKQGMLDGLRQIGVVLGQPSDVYNLLGLPSLDVISLFLMRTQGFDIQYPIFSRLSPSGKISLRYPNLEGVLTPWLSTYEAIPNLICMIWKTIDRVKYPGTYQTTKNSPSPLYLANGRIPEYISDVLLDVNHSTILIVPAKKIRNKGLWSQLQNDKLGQQKNKLVFDNQPEIGRDHPAWKHLMGIVRYRGPVSEVPDYYPVSDRLGKPLDYLAPQAWFSEETGIIRYLGVGITQSTAANREEIHRDAHSMLHSRRKRPKGKEIEVGASYRYGHARLVEFTPFFVSEDLGDNGAIRICQVAQLTRMMGWHSTTLNLPWPSHIADSTLRDALDVIAKYDG